VRIVAEHRRVAGDSITIRLVVDSYANHASFSFASSEPRTAEGGKCGAWIRHLSANTVQEAVELVRDRRIHKARADIDEVVDTIRRLDADFQACDKLWWREGIGKDRAV